MAVRPSVEAAQEVPGMVLAARVDLLSQAVAISHSVPPDLREPINKVPAPVDRDKADLRDLPGWAAVLVVPEAQADPVAQGWEDPVWDQGVPLVVVAASQEGTKVLFSARCATPWITRPSKGGNWNP
jgi:hypothetical protein